MRARIERNADTGTDVLGQPEKGNFVARNDLPCSVSSKMRRQVIDEDKTVIVEDIRGKFERDADLLEADRISAVVDRQGKVLFDGPLDVVVIVRRPRHLEAMLERFK